MLILAIESSCDDTSVALVENGRNCLACSISSQIDIHKLYGGVVPEIASRNHVLSIDKVYEDCLKKAGKTMDDVDAIAVTYGAGLLGSLIVGVNFAKGLALASGKPLVAVNHIRGHVAGNYITHPDLKPPFVCLVVSGGHTCLMDVKNYNSFKCLASTTDDAIGECFDKVARVCGLDYPGGPNISRQAQNGKATIKFVAKPHRGDSFSYSGLKTAVINFCHKEKQAGRKLNVPDICASFQTEAVEQVVEKSIAECLKRGSRKLAIAGGVSANKLLRERLEEECKKRGIQFFAPLPLYSTDNAAMIGSIAYFMVKGKKLEPFNKKQAMIAPTSTLPL